MPPDPPLAKRSSKVSGVRLMTNKTLFAIVIPGAKELPAEWRYHPVCARGASFHRCKRLCEVRFRRGKRNIFCKRSVQDLIDRVESPRGHATRKGILHGPRRRVRQFRSPPLSNRRWPVANRPFSETGLAANFAAQSPASTVSRAPFFAIGLKKRL